MSASNGTNALLQSSTTKFQKITVTAKQQKIKNYCHSSSDLKPNQHAISMVLSWLIAIVLILMLSGCPWPVHNHNNETKEVPQTDTIAPIASFSFSTNSGKAPLLISFTDNSSNGSAAITS